jgi:2-dehydropantoate 2-reductase
VIGCVVHLAASVREPGVIQLNMGNRLVLGEPDDTKSTRLSDTAALLSDAGFDVEVSESIHYDLWYKLWGNMTVNPVSAITGAETDAILADPALRIFITNAMLEAKVIAQKLDLNIGEEPEQRHQVTEKLGGFKTSMLQDVESGKPIELDALVTVVCEIARQLDVSVPNITALLGITRVFAKTNNLVTSDA